METGRNGNRAKKESAKITIGKGEHRIILIVDEQPIACEFEKNYKLS